MANSNYENLIVEKNGRIARVTINRPSVHNAMNLHTLSELETALNELDADNSVGSIIITGAGEKAFIAGADIKELADASPEQLESMSHTGQRVFGRIESCSKPVLAAINGSALGGGLELALACHMRTAVPNAQLGLPEVSLGIIPGYGGTQRLPRIIGKGLALEMILSGTAISGEEAFRIGLVNRVFAAETLLEETEKIAQTIIMRSSTAVKLAIEAVNKGLETDLESGLNIESELFKRTGASKDSREGLQAFLEKRKPDFKND